MKLWLLVLLIAATTLASDVEHVKNVLRTWKSDQPIIHLEHENYSQKLPVDNNLRPVVSVSDYLPPTPSCQTPGYTGDHCIYPICNMTNWKVQAPETVTGKGALIDAASLKNCSQSYVIFVDETMGNIRVQLQADNNINPRFLLRASNGDLVSPDAILHETPQLIEGFFGNLNAGQYVVIPSADLTNINCNLIIQANTDVSVVAGFTANESGDRDDFPSIIAYNAVPVTTVAHMFGGFGASRLTAVTFFGENNVIFRPHTLYPRFKCMYDYFFQSFSCPSIGNFYMQFEGMTFAGFTFRRIVPFTCNNNGPVTTVTPPVVTKCKNNGVMVKNLDNSTYCYCQGMWTGADCSQIVCVNGGTVTSDNTCRCPASFGGQFCNDVVCADDAGFGFDADHPTITLVIRTRQQLKYVIENVASATKALVNNINAFDPNYIRSYALVLFNNDAISLNKRYDTIDQLFDALTVAAATNSTNGGCSDGVFSAISAALDMYLSNKSPVYVITDAIPDDLSLKNQLLYQLSLWRLPLNIIYIKPDSTCQISSDDQAYRIMDDVAKKSGGMILAATQNTDIYSLVYNHMDTLIYHSQMLLSNDINICNQQNMYQTVAVDNSVDQLSIIATGNNLTLTVTSPDQAVFQAISPYSDGNNYIWLIKGPQSSNWFFNITSAQPTSFCNFKVYQKSLSGRAGSNNPFHDLFWAFTPNLEGDGELFQPLYGVDLAMTAHLTNYIYTVSPEYVHTELTMYASRNGQQVQVYASNGIWRDGCTYNFYFPPFTCQVPDETIYFNFYARDSVGMAIQRAGVISCLTFTPTSSPPSQCLNGGVMGPDNSTCYCPATYSGQYCQTINCFNGGTPMGNFCQCPNGWADQFCTIATCFEKGPDPEILRNFVDMVFVVEMTKQGLPQIAQLNIYFADLLRDIQSQDPNWIGNYVLVGFNSTFGDVLHISPSWNPTGIIHALNTLAQTVPTDTGCTVQLYRALDNAVRKRATPPGSYVEIFLTSPPDNSERGGWGEAYEYSRAFYLTFNGFLAFSPRNPNGYFCNATDDQFQLLYDLTDGSTGTVYKSQPATISEVIRVIPMQYSSGLVWTQYSPDCTSNPMSVYFPVDAYVQTIQFNVYGANSTINIYDPNGNLFTTQYNLLHDDYSHMDVFEIRKPCDDEWTESGQYCLRFEYVQSMSWQNAKDFCASFGAQLADDMTDNQHGFLQSISHNFNFWFGLSNDGSQYLWDRGRSQSVPLNQTIQYWYPDGVQPPYDPEKSCVYFDPSIPSGKDWKLDNCNTTRPFACQKHRYDQNYGSGDLGDNVLPAGKWRVDVSTQKNTQVQACYIDVRVQSSLQIFTSYTTNMFADVPSLDPVQDNPNNMVMTYIHSEDNAHRTPILTHARIWDAYNGTFYNAAQYLYRAGCSYSWISQNFACPNNGKMNEYGITHYGEDEFGNAFQRISFGHCSPQVLTCGNGGVRSNGTCVCDEYWQGRDCLIPVCVNNGTLDSSDSRCVCPKGYSGPNCQYDQCLPRKQYSFLPNNRTLAIALELTQLNQISINQLAYNLTKIINTATSKQPTWFGRFVLITFDANNVLYSYYNFPDVNSMQQAIYLLASKQLSPGSCTSNIFKAVDAILMQRDRLSTPDSQVLLFTASTAADYLNRGDTVAQFGATEAQLTWIYDTNSKCGSLPQDASASHLIRLSYATDGNTLFVDASNLLPMLSSYLSTRYLSSTLTNPTYASSLQCSYGTWYVEVESEVDTIYITTTNTIGTVTATSPEGYGLQTQMLYRDQYTKLVAVTPTIPGIYKIQLSSPGICLVSVYATGGIKVYQYFAHTTDSDPIGAHIDGTQKTPNAGISTIVTFHVEQKEYVDLKYVQIVDLVTNKAILGSPLYPRRDCSWEYYSDPFVCQSDMIAVLVYGQDATLTQFRRQLVAFCVNGTLPTNPPITSTVLPYTGSTASVSTPAPITSTTPVPATSSTPAPSTPSTPAPSTPSTSAPATPSTPAPSTPSTPAPSTPSTSAPATPSTPAPSTQSTPAPSTPSTPAPSTPSTPAPSTPSTPAPSTPSTPAPATSSTSAPATPSTTPADPYLSLQVDMLVLLDVSNASAALYDDMSNFVSNVLGPFSIESGYVRPAIIAVLGTTDPQRASAVVGFNGIQTRSSLISYLQQTKDSFGDFGDVGQYLNKALSIGTSAQYRTVDNGYRPSINNHVILYVTATSTFSDNPSTTSILQNNQYGIITVGYGPQANNKNNLQQISGGEGCTFYAPNKSTLLKTLVPAVQNLILVSTNNGGKYCGN